MIRYCTYCGNLVDDRAIVCFKCGGAIPMVNSTGLLSCIYNISQKIKTWSYINGVISVMQMIYGFSKNWYLFLIGALNLIFSIQNVNYSEKFLQKPIGIVDKMQPIGEAVFIFLYNLIIGGCFSTIGSMYYFLVVRGYVMENKLIFMQIEHEHSSLVSSERKKKTEYRG